MENIRTRNDATPAPKLPLTWDENTQDSKASEQSTQEQPPVQEQLVQQPSAPEQSVQQPPVQEQLVQQPSAQEQPSVQAPPAQEQQVQEQSVPQPPVQEQSVSQPPVQAPPAQEQQVQEPSVPQPPVQEPQVQEPSVQPPPVQEQTVQAPPVQDQPQVQPPPAQEQSVPQPRVQASPVQEQTVQAPPVQEQPQVQAPPAQAAFASSSPVASASVLTGQPAAAQEQAQEILTLKTPDEPTSVILKRARSERGVSISDVCKKVYITRTFIVDLENGNFRDLPPKEQCLAQIERLCREYDIPAVEIVAKFEKEYTVYSDEKQSSEKTSSSQLSETKHPGYGFSPRSRQINLPSILIILFVLFLVALFGYAFYAYNSRKLPAKLNIDLSEHVPIHKPKAVYLDEIRVRK